MRLTSNKLSSGCWLACLTALLSLALSVEARATSRSFQMGLYVYDANPNLTSTDVDLSMFGEGQDQPDGLSIMRYKGWESLDTSTPPPDLSVYQYDWSRIVAVMVDEPYISALQSKWPGTNQDKSPCYDYPGERMDLTIATAQRLAEGAAAVKAIAPFTRFWVNFTDKELGWAWDSGCEMPVNFNETYIDVISVDIYYVPFNPGIKSYYDVLAATRATPSQQVALIPGTFYRTGKDNDNPSAQASLLQAYFDYANSMNQTCNLPLGDKGVTGIFDGCPVWIVLGFPAITFVQDRNTYHGELAGSVITQTWQAEVAIPIRPDIPYKYFRYEIVSDLIQHWFN